MEASTPLKGWDDNIFRFVSWTNGNGLKEVSGTFTVPEKDTTVTVNYEQTTVTINFATTEMSKLSGGIVLVIDEVGYDYWDLPSTYFIWEKGTTHTVTAVTPLLGWNHLIYTFSSWTNGNGLEKASGTYKTPDTDANVIANYDSSK